MKSSDEAGKVVQVAAAAAAAAGGGGAAFVFEAFSR